MNPPLLLLLTAALCLTASKSPSQDQSQDPRQILQDSAQALQTTPGFSAKATLTGEGSKMILSTMPSMTARITMGDHPQYNRVLHFIGQLKPTTIKAPESFDILYSNDTFVWADHPKQTLNIRPPSVSAREKPTIYSYILVQEIIKDNPFKNALDTAQSIELEPSQTIDGIECHSVLITKAKPKRGARAGAHTKERWLISTLDKLPRRVEQITDAGMIKASLIMELSNLTTAQQNVADLDVFKPDNYITSDTTQRQTPSTPDHDQPFNKPEPDPSPNPANNTPNSPDLPVAPNYSFTDISNTTISRSTQQGRITLLHFFGSWSIPSKQTSPLLSTLTDELESNPVNPVDVFAIALRESDTESIQSDHHDASYTLAINPPTDLTTLFKVRIYPTIIVIDQDNRIVFNEHLSRDRNAQELIDQAKAAIKKALQ